MASADASSVADSLLSAYDNAALLSPISHEVPGFATDDAYAVLERIAADQVSGDLPRDEHDRR